MRMVNVVIMLLTQYFVRQNLKVFTVLLA